MKLSSAFLVIFLSKICSCSNANSQCFFSTDKFEERKFGDLSVTNDIWGNNAGYQEIRANSGEDWCTKCSHSNNDGVKSYPHTTRVLNRTVSCYKVMEATYAGNASVNQGYWSFSFDIWLKQRRYEIMLWMVKTGQIQPVGSVNKNDVKLGGYTWTVWKGNNGQNEVFSFVNQKTCWKGKVNIKAIVDWIIKTTNWIPEGQNVVIDEIQHGFELTSTPTDARFCMSDFQLNIS